MNVLVVGGGGREHALAWKLGQSPEVQTVFVAKGNAGTEADAVNVDIAENDFPALVEFVKKNGVGLTVVGPEAPLAAGIVDAFRGEDLPIFGPSRAAAELEASKVFCKNLLRDAAVPTADYRIFSNAAEAKAHIEDRPRAALVVKADGLAAGKGVIVCSSQEEALAAVDRVVADFGTAGARLVVEERLEGEEASVLAITDGRTIVPLQPAQDHKPALDGDKGPNTGGMGAYCPAPVVDEAMLGWIEEKVLVPTVHAMKHADRAFQGVLYAGLMITKHGPKILEYNVRFGDPECQPLLYRLNSDLFQVLFAAAKRDLASIDPLEWDPRPAVCVVMASEGYPGSYKKGFPIRGLDDAAAMEDVKVFHAGTARIDNAVVNVGGRVLGVTAKGDTIAKAKLNAYSAVKKIRWEGAWCRTDISDKALQ